MKNIHTALVAVTTAWSIAFVSGTVFGGDRDRTKHHENHRHHAHNGHSMNGHYGNYGHNGHNNHYGYANYGYSSHPYGYGYSYGYPASTYREGVLRGWASLVRAQGQYNLDTAIAANFIEEARSRNLDNQVKRTETFFAKRAINKAARTTETKEQAAAKTVRIAEKARPDRLGPTQYRPDLGLINWPSMLRRPEFQELRESMDTLLAVGPQALHRHGSVIDQQAKAMREAMRPLVSEVSPPEYAAARQFLLSLRYESQLALRGLTSPSVAIVATR